MLLTSNLLHVNNKDFYINDINIFDAIWKKSHETGIHKGFIKVVILDLHNISPLVK